MIGDLLVIFFLLILTYFAVRSLRKNKSSCSGNCASCSSGGCQIDWKEVREKVKDK